MTRTISLYLLVFCLFSLTAISQNTTTLDTSNIHLRNQVDAMILYQQQFFDSLVKAQLQIDIQKASGNRDKTMELEAKLKTIEVQDSLRKAELNQKIELLRTTSKGSAVISFNDTLFFIFTKIASYSPEERAENITRRIKKIYNDPFFNPDSLKAIKTEYGSEIIYNNDMTVMAVNNIDALLLAEDDFQLANKYLKLIRENIVEERNANSLTSWVVRIGWVVLILVGLSLLIFLINKAFSWLSNRIIADREKFLDGLTINKIQIFTPEHFEKFILRLNNLLRIALIILIVYLALPLMFSLFPETKMWTTTLIEWVLSPARSAFNGIIGFLPNLFYIIVIVYIFKYAIKGMEYFVDQIDKGVIEIKEFHADWAHPTFRILKFLLYAFMIVLIFPYLPGSGSPAFQGISVFIGILFSLGSSSAIANMVAGMVITYMRPFKIGDRVKIGDVTGDVIEKTMLVTRIKTIKNEDVTVPNSTVLLSSTTNYSTNTRLKDSGLIVHTTVTIGYDVPWKNMHKALIDAALRTEFILKKPQPFVLQTSLDDFYVSYQINGYTKEANKQAHLYSQLHQNIQDCCNEAGIEIMSPHYRNQRDGNETTIPSNYLNDNYKPPTFNVNISEKG